MVQPLTGLVEDLQYVKRVCKDHVEEFAKSELPDESEKFTVDTPQRSAKQIKITASDDQFLNGGITIYRKHGARRKTTQNQRKETTLNSTRWFATPCLTSSSCAGIITTTDSQTFESSSQHAVISIIVDTIDALRRAAGAQALATATTTSPLVPGPTKDSSRIGPSSRLGHLTRVLTPLALLQHRLSLGVHLPAATASFPNLELRASTSLLHPAAICTVLSHAQDWLPRTALSERGVSTELVRELQVHVSHFCVYLQQASLTVTELSRHARWFLATVTRATCVHPFQNPSRRWRTVFW